MRRTSISGFGVFHSTFAGDFRGWCSAKKNYNPRIYSTIFQGRIRRKQRIRHDIASKTSDPRLGIVLE